MCFYAWWLQYELRIIALMSLWLKWLYQRTSDLQSFVSFRNKYKNVYFLGCKVEFHFDATKQSIKEIWIGGRSQMTEKLTYEAILSWCLNKNVESSLMFKLVSLTIFFRDVLEKLFLNMVSVYWFRRKLAA